MSHYDTLEISPHASPEVVRAAYKSLMQRHHPDRHPGDAQAAQRCAEITSAYEVLSDPNKRQQYDQLLAHVQVLRERTASPSDRFSPAAQGEVHRDIPHPSLYANNHLLRDRFRDRSSSTSAPGETPPTRLHGWLGLLLVVLAVLAWLVYKPKSAPAPTQELEQIRAQIQASQTPESERQRLFSRKTELLEQNPSLQATQNALAEAEKLHRSFALLTTPWQTVPGSGLRENPGTTTLSIQQIQVVLGSFDSQELLVHAQKHRPRLIEALQAKLAQEKPDDFRGSAAQDRLKRLIQNTLNESLGIPALTSSYPSNFFESPGRYGVVEVQLPQGFQWASDAPSEAAR